MGTWNLWMSSILGGEPSKARSFPIKRRVIWVSGVILPRLNFVNLLWVFNVGTMYHTLRIRFSPAMSQFQRSNPIGSIYLIFMGFQCRKIYHTCFISGNPNLNQVLLCDVPSSNCSNAFLPLFPPLRLCAKVLWPEKKKTWNGTGLNDQHHFHSLNSELHMEEKTQNIIS